MSHLRIHMGINGIPIAGTYPQRSVHGTLYHLCRKAISILHRVPLSCYAIICLFCYVCHLNSQPEGQCCIEPGIWTYRTSGTGDGSNFSIGHIGFESSSRLVVDAYTPFEPTRAWYSSEDAGLTWKQLESLKHYRDTYTLTDDAANEYLYAHTPRFTTTPSDPNVGYRVECSPHYNCADSPKKLVRTSDGGKSSTFQPAIMVNSGEPAWLDHYFAIHPANSNKLFFLSLPRVQGKPISPRRLCISEDGGVSFRRIDGFASHDTIIKISRDGKVLLAVDAQENIIISRNEGFTWEVCPGSTKLRQKYMVQGRSYKPSPVEAIFHPNDNRTFFVVTTKGTFKTTDAGNTFCMMIIDRNIEYAETMLSLAFDPKDSNVMYMGTWYGLYKSVDGGCTWAKLYIHGSLKH